MRPAAPKDGINVQGGRLVIIVNEAKSITPEIFSALDRCHGYSTGSRSHLPALGAGCSTRTSSGPSKPSLLLLQQILREKSRCLCLPARLHSGPRARNREAQREFVHCPDELKGELLRGRKGRCHPGRIGDDCESVEPTGETLGIGLDCAAGGDETCLAVRRVTASSTNSTSASPMSRKPAR